MAEAPALTRSMTLTSLLRSIFLCSLFLSPAASPALPAPQGQTGNLTIDKLMAIRHPSDPAISPDGQQVAFIWDECGVQNLYVVPVSGGRTPSPITSLTTGRLANFFWGPDSRTIYFPQDGKLWQASTGAGNRGAPSLPTTRQGSNFTLSPSGRSLAFTALAATGFDLEVVPLKGGKARTVAHDDINIEDISWSPDESHLLYWAGNRRIRHDQTPNYSGSKIIYTITEWAPGKLAVAAITGGAPVTVRSPAGAADMSNGRWLDRLHVLYDQLSADFKKRTIFAADIRTGVSQVAHQDVDAKFYSAPGDTGDAGQPSPDGKWICFLDDRSGWDALYVMPSGGGTPVQLTTGHFDVWRPVWSHDSHRIAFDANSADHPGDRQIFVTTIGEHPKADHAIAVTKGRGTNIASVWSPDDSTLLYQHTDSHNSADLFAVDARGEHLRRLTESMPQDLDRANLVEPDFVHFPGADGTSVPGWLFLPKGLDRSKKHPAIVWIHGDGVNQNYDGWHVERNYAVYYSFHQYFLQQGYVVFAPDYRGSIGYGRDWRQGVYMDVGGKDAKDAWMAGEYLKTLPYVDANRLGVWGLSYGGFFTLIAVTDRPTLFRAAVDVAGVVDYRMYYEDPYHGGWTASRIGTPEQNPKVYDNASPLSHLNRLQRPLLVLHGTADVNVPYLQSVRLVDQALKLGKGSLLQFMMYPGEFHYFSRRFVLQDAWRRVDDFFRTNLF